MTDAINNNHTSFLSGVIKSAAAGGLVFAIGNYGIQKYMLNKPDKFIKRTTDAIKEAQKDGFKNESFVVKSLRANIKRISSGKVDYKFLAKGAGAGAVIFAGIYSLYGLIKRLKS